ncbi:glycosyltransferase family A protein [Flavobacterium sp.]|uniref:glycosyltransferase family 2 protein n=1 Tax=Flavobacterium sp. TaxID=239 RepID=UPI00262EFFFD|nr:glycosyltransferase family A protein [Flavobacterium sp.]
MNNATLPEISVVMPVYNAEKYLNEAIDSVLNQTYSNFELIILNDKSTDSSKAIIESYLAKDSRIVFINKETNVGPANLRNEGFDLARGTYIALLDADDIAKPTRFEKQIAVLKNNSEIGICGTWFTTFGDKEKSKVIQHPEMHNQIKVNFLIDCTIGNSTAFFRKEILGDIRYDKEYVPVEDYHLWSRLIVKTQFYIIQESLVDYRIHDSNISQTKIDNVKRSNRRIKIGLLKQFGIEENNPKINIFIHLIEGQKCLDFKEIKLASECYNHLINQNNILGNFDTVLLEKMLQKSIGRIIRKASKQSNSQIKFYKENFAQAYSKLAFSDKVLIQIKAIFG